MQNAVTYARTDNDLACFETGPQTALVIKAIEADPLADRGEILAEVFDRVEVLQTITLGRYRQHKCKTDAGEVFFCGDISIQLDGETD